MVKVDIEYQGDLHCKAVHGPSGSVLLTDAPKDNQGKGECFSPTDLAGTAVGTCIATIMGIIARNNNIDIAGLKISVEKEMIDQPVRKIKKLTLDIVFPRQLSEHDIKVLSKAVEACPVSRSLDPEIEIAPTFSFAE